MPLRNFNQPQGADMLDLSTVNLVTWWSSSSIRASTAAISPCIYAFPNAPDCPERYPSQTMTGKQQEQWLYQGLRRNHLHGGMLLLTKQSWHSMNYTSGAEQSFNMDQWDGCVAADSASQIS